MIMDIKVKRPQRVWRWIATAAWFFIVLFIVLSLFGCATTKEQPMYDNLLFESEYKNLAYKSVTKKDYEAKDDC